MLAPNLIVKLNNIISNPIEIKREVRQGCMQSPLLLNIYSETLASLEMGINVNGVWIKNIRYADVGSNRLKYV